MSVEAPVEIKVTCKQAAGFYVRACKNFFEGLPAREEQEAREPVDSIIVSALGNAISVGGVVVGRLVTDGLATVTKVETAYPKIESGRGSTNGAAKQVAQMRATLVRVSDEEEPISEEGYHPKFMGTVKKEGGKKGSELTGAADMGGIEWFTTTCETPKGDPRLLEIVNQEMNAEVDPEAEETKGGSKRVAKCLLSAGDDQLAFLCYVPKDKTKTISAKTWINHLIKGFGDYGEIVGTPTDRKAVAIAKLDKEGGKFPLKLRDLGISTSVAFLKEKGVFPDEDSDSDEMVFGDDDFPCDQEDWEG